MQSVSTWLTSCARPPAALLAGGLSAWVGVRPTLIAGACLLIVPIVILYRSPVRRLRTMPGLSGTTASRPADLASAPLLLPAVPARRPPTF
ncbi:hypothetical protein [Streptomyces pratensis]|uniref:hypothetical protein n=1 Tax=Streptomyces pratensis TaxID=1169025 RepID=UPI001934510D|nr:hypothetical protein [Streptomyces pratensis]